MLLHAQFRASSPGLCFLPLDANEVTHVIYIMGLSVTTIALSAIAIALCFVIWQVWRLKSAAGLSTMPIAVSASSLKAEAGKLQAAVGVDDEQALAMASASLEYAMLQRELESALGDLTLKYDALSAKLPALESSTATALDAVTQSKDSIATMIESIKKDMQSNLDILASSVSAAAGESKLAADHVQSLLSKEASRLDHFVETMTSIQAGLLDLRGSVPSSDYVLRLSDSLAEYRKQADTQLAGLRRDVDAASQRLDSVGGSEVGAHEATAAALRDYIMSNDYKNTEISGRLQAYISNQYDVNVKVQANIDRVALMLGDMSAYNGAAVSEVLAKTNSLVSRLETDTSAIQAKLAALTKANDSMGDVAVLKDGFVSYAPALKLLRTADGLMRGARFKAGADVDYLSQLYRTYDAARRGVEGSDLRTSPSNLRDIVGPMLVYIQYLDLPVDKATRLSELMSTAAQLIEDTSKIKTIADYLGNVQLATGALSASDFVRSEDIESLKTTVKAINTMVGDVSSPGSSSLIDSVASLVKTTADLSEDSTTKGDQLVSLQSDMAKASAALQSMAQYHAMVQSMQGDIVMLMDRTGTGTILAPNLSAAVESIWAEMRTQQQSNTSASSALTALKQIVGTFNVDPSGNTMPADAALAAMSGDLVSVVSGLKKTIEYQSRQFGGFRSEDFNQLTLVQLLQSLQTRITGTEVSSLAQTKSIQSMTAALGDVASLKTALMGSDDATTPGLLKRVVDVEKTIVAALARLDVVEADADRGSSLNASVIEVVNQMLPIFNDFKDKIGPLPKGYATFGAAIAANDAESAGHSDNIYGLIQRTLEMKAQLSDLSVQQLASSASVADAVDKASSALAATSSLSASLSSNTSTLQSLVSTAAKLQQTQFATQLAPVLASFIAGYANVAEFVESRVPSARATLVQMAEVQGLLSSFVEWGSNDILAFKMLQMHKGVVAIFVATKSYLDAGSKIDPVNQSAMGMAMYSYYIHMNTPLTDYMDVMTRWTDQSPTWLALASVRARVTDLEPIVSSLGKEVSALQSQLGAFESSDGTVGARLVGLRRSLDVVGTWTPTTLDATLAAAVSRTLDASSLNQAEINSLKGVIGSFSSSDPAISNQLKTASKSIEDIQSGKASVQSVTDLKAALDGVVQTIGAYNGSLATDIASIQGQLLALGDISGFTGGTSIKSSLDSLRSSIDALADTMTPTMALLLVSAIRAINGLVANETNYTSVAQVHRSAVRHWSDTASVLDLDQLRAWNPRMANLNSVATLEALRSMFESETRAALAQYASDGGAASNLRTALPFILGTMENRSVQSELASANQVTKALAARVTTLESGPGADRLQALLAMLKSSSSAIQMALPRMTSDYNFPMRTLVSNLAAMDAEIGKFQPSMTNDSMFDAIGVSYREIASRGSSNGIMTGVTAEAAYVQPFIDSFLANAAIVLGNSTALVRLRGAVRSLGVYTGTASVAADLAATMAGLTSATNSISSLNVSVADMAQRLATVEAGITNMQAATLPAVSEAGAMTSTPVVLPGESRSSLYALCYIKDGNIVSESYPSGYTGTRRKTTTSGISIRSLLELCHAYPENVSATYVAIAIQALTLPANTQWGAGDAYAYLLAVRGNTVTNLFSSIDSIPTTVFTGTAAGATSGVGSIGHLPPQKQVAMTAADIVRLIESTRLATLKRRDGNTIGIEIFVNISATDSIRTGATIPAKTASFSVMPIAAVAGLPMIEPSTVLNLSKHGLIVPNTPANTMPTMTSTSSSGISTMLSTCPDNAYMCGMSYTLGGSTIPLSVRYITPHCCAFSPVR